MASGSDAYAYLKIWRGILGILAFYGVFEGHLIRRPSEMPLKA